MKRGKRYFFPDEEPEPDFPWLDLGYAETSDLCPRCGLKGHRYVPGRSECPNDPVMNRVL